ncbi:HipA domain-containing protein [Nitratidesulfovibrio liaohensis]|uniref:Type II toxin-antitoxin system HipA family toxin n=1 Tax=Nitratidesulfovibrio liaohensis TaxID=2604158 RepID=A0ABY9QWR0_9BACT|nr:HipA domain-containing protein [Nitratidesulfovibrio liaohensis]WMW63956.1 type II toxin-antitoxin system HipA family toxin [Nitratidesulfovibrio liaohensis]
MTSSGAPIYVFVWLKGQGYVPAALLTDYAGGRRCTLGYGRNYAARPDAIPIDPVSLPLYMPHVATSPSGSAIFPALRDAAPDKWGRKLLALLAGRPAGPLSEVEVLTAAHSRNRIGALAFGGSPAGPESMAPWATGQIFSLHEGDLGRVGRVVAEVDELDDDADLDALRRTLPEDVFLRALASSLSVGGGRPKALVSVNGVDHIAKFSKRGDVWDEPRVEHATMTLAARCGIAAAQTRVVEADGVGVLLVRRFDRDDAGEPVHFVSGFTLNRRISEDGDWGSYQDLAQVARQHGDERAGHELFRRMAFNVLCRNVDDHPRNHAFFVRRNGIALTPVFDVVPAQIRFARPELALACGHKGREASVENVLSMPEPFGLRRAEAEDVMARMRHEMRGWRGHFEECGVSGADISRLEERFALVSGQ